MRPVHAGLALVVLLTGCIAAPVTDDCIEPSLVVLTGPVDDAGRAHTGPEGRLPVLAWANATNASRAAPTLVAGGVGVAPRPFEILSEPGAGLVFGHADLADRAGSTVDVVATVQAAGTCRGVGRAAVPVETQGPVTGAGAEVGQGVLVHTAGFWTNGTLFYTNMARVQFDLGVPRPVAGDMAEWGGDDPLPVYIYRSDRSEMPRRYQEAGYFTTIPGFNRALQGLVEGTSRVAVLAPEDAYTRPGNERHQLYGDTLVFYIELVEIRDEPCPVPEPVCDLPRVPPPPSVAASTL